MPVGATLLIYAFMYEEDYSLISCAAYVASAYALTIVCAYIAKMPKADVRAVLYRNPFLHRYLTDVPFKIHVSLYLSMGLNMLFAAIKLFYGIYYRSVWFGTLAVYYIMLAVMRFLLLHHVNKAGIGSDMGMELKQYRLCGVILMLMNIALSGVVVLVVWKNQGFHYAGYLIYVMALYAFYNIISAVIDVLRYRKYKSPVMSASKVIKLAAALVSMLSLETAMLMQFNDQENSEAFRRIMTGATGGGVCIIVLTIAVYMIVKSTRQLNEASNIHAMEECYD